MNKLSRLLEWVRAALLGRRTPGKHGRRAHVAPPAPAVPVSRPVFEPFALDGHAHAMVRPYLFAHERLQERQQQRQRRRALVMATMGVDFLPEVRR